MRNFELFIDELGTSAPKDLQSDIYVLCGCAVPVDERENLKIHADRVKFKYWGKTNVTFHSRTIGYKEDDFKIFKKNKQLWNNFLNDLISFLKEGWFTVFAVVCDKRKARKSGWNSVKIVKETARRMFYHYITWLFGLTQAKGKITVESATAEKDRYYLNEFSHFLSPGCKELDVDYKKIQSKLTSIAFVSNSSDFRHKIVILRPEAEESRLTRSFAYAQDDESLP